MPSYQPTTTASDPTGRRLTFTAAVAISAATRDWLASKITARRCKMRSRRRKLDPATLVLAFLRTNLTYAELATANHISRATCGRIINEGIDLLAEHAMRLGEVVRLADKAGWHYLLIDGVPVPTVAFARKLHRRQRHYSGKHRRHGVNVQTVCAPTGGCCGPRPRCPATSTTSPPPVATTCQARSGTCWGSSPTWATSVWSMWPPASAVPAAGS